ncbi:MAG: DNA polymerase III, subunit gamma and tau [Parcubacteria group bacterium 21-54-25]|nr:MAG: DNA polymerase III, subunit gamma and tau [Parcubacteria group bacterium 21-54-25]HQU07934.1 DNA polymerase III subunit gamma/tau [Candidatus Paceibacterota bacterium]
MAHQSLYRTYRPRTFNEVEEQPQVTQPLIEQVKEGKIGHAYLFAGSRGLGKTSVARIFARAVGCTEKDLYEIDAASHNSVEDIRTLTEGVYTLPFESPYKVYILDEVHMLSKAAWNAFLKTLEEPPAHAIFILATTELEKVPETVRSRCQVFEFKKPSRAALAQLVARVAKKEKYKLDPDAAELVALLADGSYRDALSVLERVLASASGTTLSRAVVETVTGAPKRELVHGLIAALAEGSRGAALVAIERTAKSGADMQLFLMLVIESLRATLLLRYAPDLHKALAAELGKDEYETLSRYAKSETKPGVTHATLLAFLNAVERIRFSPVPSVPLELAVFELMGSEDA